MEEMPAIRSLGPGTLMLDLGAPNSLEKQQRIWAMHAVLLGSPGFIECVPGMNNLCVRFDPLRVRAENVRDTMVEALDSAPAQSDERDVSVTIAVRYGGEFGPDMNEVCESTGLSKRDVIERHSGREYRVYFIGFQPGFAYLGDLDPMLHVPRRATPRPRVAAGSIGIGGIHTGVYPFASPGGWNIIGRTRERLFDVDRIPPALLRNGMRVRFVPER